MKSAVLRFTVTFGLYCLASVPKCSAVPNVCQQVIPVGGGPSTSLGGAHGPKVNYGGYHGTPWCVGNGNPCGAKMKRLANAADEALALASAGPDSVEEEWCYASNGPCAKAKRDALALAEAVAQAHATAGSESFEHVNGKVLATRDLVVEENSTSTAILPRTRFTWCYRPGQPCRMLRRIIDEVTDAIHDDPPMPNLDTASKAQHEACLEDGQPCHKHKHAMEGLWKDVHKL